MKKERSHIIITWVLLLCFIAGQFIVYSHNHTTKFSAVKSAAYHNRDLQPHQTVTENCQLCDAMHHNTMAINTTACFAPVVESAYFYKAVDHDFISVALILSAGRSPPMA